MFAREQLVETIWDAGGVHGSGVTILYGRVTQAGPKTATITWESGLRNRVGHDSPSVRPARDVNGAAEAMKKVQL